MRATISSVGIVIDSLHNQESEYLRKEQRAYERFREQVRLARPDSVDATGSSRTSEQLVETYREEVMKTLDRKRVYGDTLAISLETELSPAIADAMLSNEPLTQRRKRNLLVETTVAIERREQFLTEIIEERMPSKRLLKNSPTLNRLSGHFRSVRHSNNYLKS